MSNRLFIRLGALAAAAPETSSQQVSWLRTNQSGPVSGVGRGSLTEAASVAGGCKIIVLVPGSDVLLAQVDVPSQNRQRIARAVPYVLEDRLGSEVEQLHFALGARGQDNKIGTAVVDRDLMSTWLELLRDAGLKPDVIAIETLALPIKPGTWFVLSEAGGATVRTGLQSGFAADNENLDIMLSMAIAELADDKPTNIHVIDNALGAAVLHETLNVDSILEVSRETYNEEPLILLAQGFDEKTTINLLQGDYSFREQIGKMWRPWRPAIALLMAYVLLQGGMAAAEVSRLSREAESLQPQIEQIYRKAFPGTSKIVNPRVQMERNLSELRGTQGQAGDGFLALLTNSGAALKATPELELRNVSYKEGELNLELDIKDLQTLDQLKQRLATESGLDIEIQSATSRDNKVQSRLQIRPKNTQVEP